MSAFPYPIKPFQNTAGRTIGGVIARSFHGDPIKYGFVSVQCDADLMTPAEIAEAQKIGEERLRQMRAEERDK